MRSRDSLASAQARLRAKFVPQRRNRGRPRLGIDPIVVYSMARDGHGSRAIADCFACDPGTIRRRFGRLLRYAREYRTRWAWLGADTILEALLRGEERRS